jgi:hypothetical protein
MTQEIKDRDSSKHILSTFALRKLQKRNKRNKVQFGCTKGWRGEGWIMLTKEDMKGMMALHVS